MTIHNLAWAPLLCRLPALCRGVIKFWKAISVTDNEDNAVCRVPAPAIRFEKGPMQHAHARAHATRARISISQVVHLIRDGDIGYFAISLVPSQYVMTSN